MYIYHVPYTHPDWYIVAKMPFITFNVNLCLTRAECRNTHGEFTHIFLHLLQWIEWHKAPLICACLNEGLNVHVFIFFDHIYTDRIIRKFIGDRWSLLSFATYSFKNFFIFDWNVSYLWLVGAINFASDVTFAYIVLMTGGIYHEAVMMSGYILLWRVECDTIGALIWESVDDRDLWK